MTQRTPAYRLLRTVWRKFKLLRMGFALLADHLYDLRRYMRWSHGVDTDRTQAQAMHGLYKAYHGVEKGLSLAEPRPNFGAPKIAALTVRLAEYRQRFDDIGIPAADSALYGYQNFNAQHDVQNDTLKAYLDSRADDDATGGTETVHRDQIVAASQGADRDFFWSRHSVRQYSDQPVSMDLITQAVDMARKTPTVCNRQGPKVHVFGNAQQALDWQPGNRGFGHLASRALLVTADLQAFSGSGERNQPFIDGGMFAMSLLYALHSLGLGACPLAWSTDKSNDRKMRQALGIPDSEAAIMMISVGHLPDTLDVAKSHRMPLDHFLIQHPA